MATNAVIIVSSQGEHVSMFTRVASYLNRNLYKNKAKIVKTTVTESGQSMAVTFSKLDGKSFSWADVEDISSILTISHGAIIDGPNLGYGLGLGYQPWGTSSDSNYTELSTEGASFWSSIGWELIPVGKIILVGCSMGKTIDDPDNERAPYGQLVADTSRRTVYASNGLFAAADKETVLRHVKAIEQGSVIRPMKRFNPDPKKANLLDI